MKIPLPLALLLVVSLTGVLGSPLGDNKIESGPEDLVMFVDSIVSGQNATKAIENATTTETGIIPSATANQIEVGAASNASDTDDEELGEDAGGTTEITEGFDNTGRGTGSIIRGSGHIGNGDSDATPAHGGVDTTFQPDF